MDAINRILKQTERLLLHGLPINPDEWPKRPTGKSVAARMVVHDAYLGDVAGEIRRALKEIELPPQTRDCTHPKVVPYGNGDFGRCLECGDGSFPISDVAAGMASPREDEEPAPDPLGLAVENAVLRAALAEARTDIKDWSEYASSYMQDRWDLDGDLRKVDDALATPSPAVEAVREVVRTGVLYREAEESCDRAVAATMSASDPPPTQIGEVIVRWAEYRKAIDHLRTNFPALAAGIDAAQPARGR